MVKLSTEIQCFDYLQWNLDTPIAPKFANKTEFSQYSESSFSVISKLTSSSEISINSLQLMTNSSMEKEPIVVLASDSLSSQNFKTCFHFLFFSTFCTTLGSKFSIGSWLQVWFAEKDFFGSDRLFLASKFWLSGKSKIATWTMNSKLLGKNSIAFLLHYSIRKLFDSF